MIDTIKANLWPAVTFALLVLLALANWQIDSLEDELRGLKVVIDVQDKIAAEELKSQQERTNGLIQQISRDADTIKRNRLLYAADKARSSKTPNSAGCNNEAPAAVDPEGAGQGFRDQAVDVALQLTYCQKFLVDNKFPVQESLTP